MNIRRQFQRPDVRLRNAFKPDGLPDARRLNIPACEVLILPSLFSSRLRKSERIIRFHDDQVASVDNRICDIKREARVTAFMFADEPPVHPDARPVVAPLKMNEDPFSRLRVHFHSSLVPDMVVSRRVMNSAHLRLIGERNQDRLLLFKATGISGALSPVIVIKCKIPCTVQILPVPADQLRSGVVFDISFHVVSSRSMMIHHPLMLPTVIPSVI